METGQRVYVIFAVECECEHPIAGASVKVTVNRMDNTPDATIYGWTNADGIFAGFYRRSNIDLSITSYTADIIACRQRTIFNSSKVAARVDPNALLDFYSSAKGLFKETPKLSPEGIKEALELVGKVPLSTDLVLWVLGAKEGEKARVQCHRTCENHDPGADKAETTLPLFELMPGSESIPDSFKERGEATVTETPDKDQKPTKYRIKIKNTDSRLPLSDIKICFEGDPKDAEVAVLSPSPRHWKCRKEGKCWICEVDDSVFGIDKDGEGGEVEVAVPSETKLGRVNLTVSTERGEKGISKDLTEPQEIPGPTFAAAFEEELPGSQTLVVTGDLPDGFGRDLVTFLRGSGFDVYELNDGRFLSTVISRTPEEQETALVESPFGRELSSAVPFATTAPAITGRDVPFGVVESPRRASETPLQPGEEPLIAPRRGETAKEGTRTFEGLCGGGGPSASFTQEMTVKVFIENTGDCPVSIKMSSSKGSRTTATVDPKDDAVTISGTRVTKVEMDCESGTAQNNKCKFEYSITAS